MIDGSVRATFLLACRGAARTNRLPHPNSYYSAPRFVIRFTFPSLWPWEMMNALAVAVRRKRIKPEQAASFLGLLSSFDFHIADGPDIADLPRLSTLASRYQLTAYDTAYLDLAKRHALPLATLDDDLQKAALAEGVEVL